MVGKPNEEFVREGTEKVTDQDIENVADHADDIRKQFSARGRSSGLLKIAGC